MKFFNCLSKTQVFYFIQTKVYQFPTGQVCQPIQFPITLSRKRGSPSETQCCALSGLTYAECILGKSPEQHQPNLAILSERFKEVSNHSSHVTLKRGAVEPGINHNPFFLHRLHCPTRRKWAGRWLRSVVQGGLQTSVGCCAFLLWGS